MAERREWLRRIQDGLLCWVSRELNHRDAETRRTAIKSLLLTLALLFALPVFGTEWDAQQLTDRLQKDIKYPSKFGRVVFNSVSIEDINAWNIGFESKFTNQKEWRCTHFANGMYFYAQYMNPRAAFGVIWFHLHPDDKHKGAHAINVFYDKDGKLRFYDATIHRETYLSPRQIESIYYVMF